MKEEALRDHLVRVLDWEERMSDSRRPSTGIPVDNRDAVAPGFEHSAWQLLETHARDIDRDTRRIINSVKNGVGKVYYAHRAKKADPDANKLDIRVEVAALLLESLSGMGETLAFYEEGSSTSLAWS
jgi:hypothetical protein